MRKDIGEQDDLQQINQVMREDRSIGPYGRAVASLGPDYLLLKA
jgi:hypothetical protein